MKINIKKIVSFICFLLTLNVCAQDSLIKCSINFNETILHIKKKSNLINPYKEKENNNGISMSFTLPSKKRTSLSFGISSSNYSSELAYVESNPGLIIDSTIISIPTKEDILLKTIKNKWNLMLGLNYLIYSHGSKHTIAIYTAFGLLMPFHSTYIDDRDTKYYQNNEYSYYREEQDKHYSSGYDMPIPQAADISLSLNYFPFKHWGILLSTKFTTSFEYWYYIGNDVCFGICYR